MTGFTIMGWAIVATASSLWIFLAILQKASHAKLPSYIWRFAHLLVLIGYLIVGVEVIPYYLWGFTLPFEWRLAKNIVAVVAMFVGWAVYRPMRRQ